MKTIASQLLIAIVAAALVSSAIAQARHDEKPHGMANAPAPAATRIVASDSDGQTIALKDGGTLILRKDGTVYHADASGQRVRMRNGVAMEAADGTQYMMRNDAIWQQITEKGSLHPNHQ